MKLSRELINDISVVCDMRATYNLSCHDCMYKGELCDKMKHKFKVAKPYELIDNNETKERFGYYYD